MENDLSSLYSLIELERDSEGSHKNEILEEVQKQKYKSHNFVFRFLVNDLLVLLGETVNEFLEPVESDEGALVSARTERFNHILKRLAEYSANVSNECIAQRLFDYKTCKIRYAGEYIEVKELFNIPREFTLVKDKYGNTLYLEYMFERGFADITDVHKLTENQTAEYNKGDLDLNKLYANLVVQWFRNQK